jgi:hypothetical protein
MPPIEKPDPAISGAGASYYGFTAKTLTLAA